VATGGAVGTTTESEVLLVICHSWQPELRAHLPSGHLISAGSIIYSVFESNQATCVPALLSSLKLAQTCSLGAKSLSKTAGDGHHRSTAFNYLLVNFRS